MVEKIRPILDKIVVLQDKEETITTGGIVLPETAEGGREKPAKGQVVGVGTGKDIDGGKRQLEVKVGDRVVYNKYAGTEVKLRSGSEIVKHLVMREEDILGVLED